MTSRRDFLKYTSLISAATLMPGFLCQMSGQSMNANGRKLVIIQLSGGCDGLNAVVPYGSDEYYRARPKIGIQPSEVLQLTDFQGLHPSLEVLRSLYDQGELTILNSVGYPNPDRSHFRSMDIWHSGSDAHEYWESGWLGRFLDHNCTGCADPAQVLEIDDSLSLAVKGDESNALAVKNPKRLHRSINDPYLQKMAEVYSEKGRSDDDLDYLYKTLTETVQSAEYVYEQSKVYKSRQAYPPNEFGKQLKLTAELIISGARTDVYYISQSGFDTHVRQNPIQDRLFKQYSSGVEAFIKDMKEAGKMDDVLIMTFSEFGRRVKQNASGGTDHGKANNLFLMGGALKSPGIFNDAPDLSHLDQGDLQWKIDFRQVYATLLHDWLKADDEVILKKKFDRLELV